MREFAAGLAEVVVVEDKTGLLEGRVIEALYPLAERPVVTGKRSPDGAPPQKIGCLARLIPVTPPG